MHDRIYEANGYMFRRRMRGRYTNSKGETTATNQSELGWYERNRNMRDYVVMWLRHAKTKENGKTLRF